MDFERNYRIKILSNQFNIKQFSTFTQCQMPGINRKSENLNQGFSDPVVVYSNAEADKKLILSVNKGKSGIYKWTHIESGRFYIGSAVDLSNRLKYYYNSNNLKRTDNYISRALLLHGYAAFSLSIVEYIDISGLSKKETKNSILAREQCYLDFIFSEKNPNTYNMYTIAGSRLGFKVSEETLIKMSEANKGENNPFFGKAHSVETKTLLSEINKGENHPKFGKALSVETKALISNAHKGKSLTDETKALISESLKGKTVSEETKTKMSIAQVKSTAIYVYDLEGTLLHDFTSARKAAEFFSCNHHTIKRYALNGEVFKDKWIISTSLKTLDNPESQDK